MKKLILVLLVAFAFQQGIQVQGKQRKELLLQIAAKSDLDISTSTLLIFLFRSDISRPIVACSVMA